ncbi:hypothetical protein ACLESD_23715 [Pyxidicoccus sp. 3LFB2]
MKDRITQSLSAEALEAVDALLLEGQRLLAIQLLRTRTVCSLPDAIEWALKRTEALKELHPHFREAEAQRERRETSPEGWRAQAMEGLEQLEHPPVALEALWDGDTTGWFLRLDAILPGASSEHPRFKSVHLVSMRGPGGDMRLLNGTVPPWPEVEVAREIGRHVQERWGAAFYFPAPDKPDDSLPRWWDTQPGDASTC